MKNILAGEKKYEKGYIKVSHEYLDEEETQNTLYYIINKKGNQFGAMRNLSRAHNGISSKNLLIEKNIEEHRLNCYIAGKLRILSTSRSSMLVTHPLKCLQCLCLIIQIL